MNTRLYWVGFYLAKDCITVYVGEDDLPCYRRLRIRSITPRAAARRYIRNNLFGDLAKIDMEYDNMAGPGIDWDKPLHKKMFERFRKLYKLSNVKIKVIKKENLG